MSLYVTGPMTSKIGNGPSCLGANFLYGYSKWRFIDLGRTLSPFLNISSLPKVWRAMAAATLA